MQTKSVRIDSIILRSLNWGAIASSILTFLIIGFLSFRQNWRIDRGIENILVANAKDMTNYGIASNDLISIQRSLNSLSISLSDAFQVAVHIDLYIDEDLIAQSQEEFQKSFWTSNLRTDFQSPGGKRIRLDIAVDHAKSALTSLIWLILLQALIVLGLFIFRNTMRKNLRWLVLQLSQVVQWSETVSQKLEQEDQEMDVLPASNIVEVSRLSAAMNRMVEEILDLQKEIKRAEFERGQYELAVQVAHDIRSPLGALKIIENDLPELDNERRAIVKSATQRIQEIANDLLGRSRGSMHRTPHRLGDLLESIVAEKRQEFRQRENLALKLMPSQELDRSVLVDELKFRRLMSNLINNSAEAIEGTGEISIRIAEGDQSIQIVIRDTGKGISPEILPRLMQKGATFQKESGSGLGLHAAKKTLLDWGGDLAIESELGKFTEVTIHLPHS